MAVAIDTVNQSRIAAFARQADDSWRTPGCGVRCRAVFARMGSAYPERVPLHDPDHHEAYGLNVLAQSLPTMLSGEVRTGALVVDGVTCVATVNGESILATPREFAMLSLMANNLGQVVSQDAMLRRIWGPEYAPTVGTRSQCHANSNAHILRVNMSRLRQKLGAASTLIETVCGFGYRLRNVPPVDGAS